MEQPPSNKTEVRGGEPAKVREHRREIALVHSKPGSQRCEILIDRRRRNPPTGAGVVRTVHREGRERAVSFSSVNCATKDEMVAAPSVIAPSAIGRKGSAKIARRKRRYVTTQAELIHRALEDHHALAELRQQIRVRTDFGLALAGCLVAMEVIATHLAKKDLPFHAESACRSITMAGLDESRDHPELRRQR